MKIRSLALAFALASLSFASTPARAADDEISIPETKSLYERLGGEAAITAVIGDFVGRAASDPAVNFVRTGTGKEWDPTPENVEMLKKHLTQFVCAATGGPQIYEGRDMKTVHEGMKITEAEFGAIAADLKASLSTFNVPQKEQDELIGIVATTQDSIVEVPAGPAS